MLFAALIAAAVTQACPAPSSTYGPPPCAAVNVPGCLPGYRRQLDGWGRAIYVCDPRYEGGTPGSCYYQVDESGRTVFICNAGYAMPAPPPAPEPPPAPVPAALTAAPAPEGRGTFGLVFMPGASSDVTGAFKLDFSQQNSHAAGAIALELRAATGGGRLRFEVEGGSFGRIVEGGVKYDFNDRGTLRPFLGLAAGAGAIDPNRSWRLEGAASVGLDFYVTSNCFGTFELKGRRFAQQDSGSSHYGLAPAPLYQSALFAGIGVYL